MSSTSMSPEPVSPRHSALDFEGWSVRSMPLDPSKHGERAVFWDNFSGSPTIVERKEYNKHKDGCIVYTKYPIPVDTAWRITLLQTADSWQRGLTIGLTPAPPEKVPFELPLYKDFNYEIKYMAPNSQPASPRERTNTLVRNLPLLWDAAMNKSICLLLTTKGDLHIYFEEKHVKKIQSGLPVNKPLWGAVDVSGRCAQIKSELLSNPLKAEAAIPEPLPCADDPALPPIECFTEKPVKVEVPPSDEMVIIAPRGLGIVLKVPPESLEQTGAPSTIAITTCTPQSFVYPEGYKSLSPIYYVAANKSLQKDLEVLVEHNANIENGEQKEEMIFCIAQPPEDGKKHVHFIPVPAGEFAVGKEHGSLITNQLGFINAGTKAADTSKIQNRYAVMCSYSNEDGNIQHVGISVSVANEIYMTNFRDSLRDMWKTSMSDLSRVPVVFRDSSAACVYFQPPNEGWEIVSDAQQCDFLKKVVDYDDRDLLSKIDYPPRFTFTIKASENAKFCEQQFQVTGLTRDVSFLIPLIPTESAMNQEGIDRPNLLSLYQLGDIRIIEETATHYFKIGVHLLNDQYGNRVEAINVDKRTATEKITEVYRTWLREEPYTSWATLCGCFRKCGFKSLAQRIEEHFRISSSQPTPLPDDRFPLSNTPRSTLQWIRERLRSLFESQD